MDKKIVVPIDISHMEKADAMIEAAGHLAGSGGSIILVNIIEELPAYVTAEFPGGVLDDEKKRARALLEDTAKKVKLDTSVEVRIGHAHTTILAVAEENEADIIIIASHKPGLTDYFLGSTASRVVRHATCSVLVLR